MRFSGLIVGLGNPGQKYAKTRHNFGFQVVDLFLSQKDQYGPGFVKKKQISSDLELYAWVDASADDKNHSWLILKPLTYMNNSGLAVSKIMHKYFFSPEKVLILHDELDLPLGRLKFKFGGGLAGHNGLRSIARHLGTREFARLRLGIGRPEPGVDIAAYVLSSFLPGEQDIWLKVVEKAVLALDTYCQHGFEYAQQMVNAWIIN
ncbi:aminoacyl-tRNA hydrolase [Desulfovulcanus sp.]